MTINIDQEAGAPLDLPYQEVIRDIVLASLDYEKCPYEAEVNIILTDDMEICRLNRDYRQIDRPTDVLSFPMLEFEQPSDFSRGADAGGYHPFRGQDPGAGRELRTFPDQGAGLFGGPQHAPPLRL